jgi:hypothetical protein
MSRNCSARMLGLVVVTLAVTCSFGVRAAQPNSNLLFGFTDNSPLTTGSRATGPALALGARGFAYFLLWLPGRSTLNQAETSGLARAIGASQGARVILVVRTAGASTPLGNVAQDQFCSYARSAVKSFPTVNDVVVGNEANAPFFWRPQYNADGSSAAPAAYEALLARCYDVLHAFRPGINVAAPGTSPHGNDNPNAVSNISHSPTRFIRGMAAAYRASGRTQRIFDTVVHHPYGETNEERPYAMHPGPYFIGEGDWNKLVATYKDAFAGTPQAVPGRCLPPGPCVPLWYLEAGFQTRPRPAPSPYFGIENVLTIPDISAGEPASPSPLATSPAPDQATQLRYALRLAYCQPYVEAVFNFLIRDDSNLVGYQSGVLWADWRPKGSYGALAGVVSEVNAGSVSCAAPSAPTSAAAQLLDVPSRVSLRWRASSSAIGVSGYRVIRNGVALGTTDGLSYVDSDLASHTSYSYVVRGYDAAGQTGDASAAIVVSTSSVGSTVVRNQACGPVHVRTRAFRVRIVRGKVSCGTARRAIRAFIARHRSPKRWRCVRARGHASWTVACTQGRRRNPRVIVRAIRMP